MLTGNIENAARVIADALNNLALAIQGRYLAFVQTPPYVPPTVPTPPYVPNWGPNWEQPHRPYVGDTPPGLGPIVTCNAPCNQADGDSLSHTD